MSDSATQTKNKPVPPPFPDDEITRHNLSNMEEYDKKKAVLETLIGYIDKLRGYLVKVREYIKDDDPDGAGEGDDEAADGFEATDAEGEGPQSGGKKKQRKTKKKGGADIDYSKVYNVQGLIENISKSTGKDPVVSQSVPAPFSTGSPLQRLGKKEAKSLPNELKNEIIPDYSQDGGKKKKTEKKKMPKKK